MAEAVQLFTTQPLTMRNAEHFKRGHNVSSAADAGPS
jgi:hypothetical protein